MSETRTEILGHVKAALVKLFELDESDIVESARLYDDLDIDSIDTIDLLIELKKHYGKEVEANAFANARTLGDVIDVISTLDAKS